MPTLRRRIYQQQPVAQHHLPRPPGKGLGEGWPTQHPHHIPPSKPAIRLGFKQVVGLSEAAAERIVAARSASPFTSAEDLAHRATLTDHDMKCLASANALQSLEGHRRSALWAAIGVDAPLSMNCNAKPVGWDAIPAAPATNRKAGIASQPTAPNVDPNIASNTDPAPRRSPAARQPGSPLSREALFTPPTEAENMLADYAHLGLTLGRHPLALLRERDPERFKRERLINSQALHTARNGQLVRTVGIVTCRQRPETAAGVTFVTLEDEAGYSNIIVWRDLGARQRNVLIHSSLMAVYGTLQNDGVSVHLIAGHLRDCSDWLEGLRVPTREFH